MTSDSLEPLLPERDANQPGDESLSDKERIPFARLFAMLAPAFAWGAVATTMVLLTLPLECQRVASTFSGDPNDNTSSLFLALFIFLGGLTELLCPIMGKLSDQSVSVPSHWGRRIPFILMGSLMSVISLLTMSLSSWFRIWIIYSIGYTIFMIGMNIIYASMIALIPDLVPTAQVGEANGVLAFEMVLGSLVGFIMFEIFSLNNNKLSDQIDAVRLSVVEMYIFYTLVLIFTCLLAMGFTKEPTDINASTEDISKAPDPNEVNRMGKAKKLLPIWTDSMHKVSSIRGKELFAAYTVSPSRHGDFFFVTVSRTFYYMGISVQTFFLYYVHDILRHHSALARESPQTLVSELALIVQFAGIFTSYPAGILSDKMLQGRRKPLIYWSCVFLSAGTFSLIFLQYVDQLEIVSVIIGLANGGYLTMETSLAVDSLEKMKEEYEESRIEEESQVGTDEIDNEKEGAAQLLGIWGVAAFVGTFIDFYDDINIFLDFSLAEFFLMLFAGVALGPLIGGPLLFIFGRLSEDDTDDNFDDDYVGGQQYSLLGYVLVFTLSAIYFVFAAVSLKWVRNCQ